MSLSKVLGTIVSQRRIVTGGVALVVFFLFVASVIWLHGVADVDSPLLGMSTFAEKAATDDRLKRALDTALQQDSLAAALADDANVVMRISKKDDNFVNAWKGLEAIATALTADESKQLLARHWAARLFADRKGIDELARIGIDAPIADGRGDALTASYMAALSADAGSWLSAVMPASRVEALLAEGYARSDVLPALVTRLHERTTHFLIDGAARRQVHRAVSDDLDPLFAQATIAAAVQKDFSARLMWVISAALFLTFAVSAAAGAVPRLLALVEVRHRRGVLALLAVAVAIAAALGQRMLSSVGPAFLSRPVREIGLAHGIELERAVMLLNVLAAVAIVALLVTAWASFLITTRDSTHLDLQLATLRWVLHTATLVLVCGVFETYALVHWPAAIMADPAAGLVESGAQVASLGIGLALSTVLLLIYVPGAIALTEEARVRQAAAAAAAAAATARADSAAAAAADADKQKIADSLTRNGFDTSATKLVTTFAQLLLPLLITAPISSFVQLIGS